MLHNQLFRFAGRESTGDAEQYTQRKINTNQTQL